MQAHGSDAPQQRADTLHIPGLSTNGFAGAARNSRI
jgi:hypothetical protein